jgi:gamma-glutamylcyclotransferase
LTYQAIQTELGLMPYCWYRDFVIQGAIEHGLPPAYIEALAAQPFIQDPDPERRQYHYSFLFD